MQELAKNFIMQYMNDYNLLMNDIKDVERLITDLSHISYETYQMLLRNNIITKEEFGKFQQTVLSELKNIIKPFQKELTKESLDELIQEAKKGMAVDNLNSYEQLLNYLKVIRFINIKLTKAQEKNIKNLKKEYGKKRILSLMNHKSISNKDSESECQNTEIIKQMIYQMYISTLENADVSYYEVLEQFLTIEGIRKNNELAHELSDSDLQKLINLIKKEALRITLEKILNLPEVKELNQEFMEKLSVLDQMYITKIQQKINAFEKSKVMLGLSDFNKSLLVSKWIKDIEKAQKKIAIMKKNEKALEILNNKMHVLPSENIFPFYFSLLNKETEELGFEVASRNELESLQEQLKLFALENVANHIFLNLEIAEIENLDKIEKKIECLDKKDLQKYQIPDELQLKLKDILCQKLNSRKKRQEELRIKLNRYLELGTKVQLNNKISIYENAIDFEDENVTKSKKVPKNKKGTIISYLVKKGNNIITISSKEDLLVHLQNDYEVIGYGFTYKHFFNKIFTYIKLTDVKNPLHKTNLDLITLEMINALLTPPIENNKKEDNKLDLGKNREMPYLKNDQEIIDYAISSSSRKRSLVK